MLAEGKLRLFRHVCGLAAAAIFFAIESKNRGPQAEGRWIAYAKQSRLAYVNGTSIASASIVEQGISVNHLYREQRLRKRSLPKTLRFLSRVGEVERRGVRKKQDSVFC